MKVKANLVYKTRTIEIIYIILLQNFFKKRKRNILVLENPKFAIDANFYESAVLPYTSQEIILLYLCGSSLFFLMNLAKDLSNFL